MVASGTPRLTAASRRRLCRTYPAGAVPAWAGVAVAVPAWAGVAVAVPAWAGVAVAVPAWAGLPDLAELMECLPPETKRAPAPARREAGAGARAWGPGG